MNKDVRAIEKVEESAKKQMKQREDLLKLGFNEEEIETYFLNKQMSKFVKKERGAFIFGIAGGAELLGLTLHNNQTFELMGSVGFTAAVVTTSVVAYALLKRNPYDYEVARFERKVDKSLELKK